MSKRACFQGVEHKSHFAPEGDRVRGELAMTAPKYLGVDDSSRYNPQTERAEGARLMTAPVFPGVEAANK